MKRKHLQITGRRLLCPLLCLSLLAACGEEQAQNDGKPDDAVAVSLTAGISQISLIRTAANGTPLTRTANGQWEAGDAIGLCMTATATSEITNEVFNYRYTSTTAGATGLLQPDGKANTAYFPADGSKVDFLAYSPYTADGPAASTLTLPVSVATQPATDVLTARADGYDREHPEVNLNFRHRLTRLLFTLKGSGIIEQQQLAGATLSISGMNTAATCHLTDGSITDASAPKDIQVPLHTESSAGIEGSTEITGEAIVLPRQAADGVSFTVTLTNGNRYVARMSATQPLSAGTQNTFRLTLRDQETVVEATIEPWQDGTDAEMEANGHEVTVETTANNSGFKAGDTFTLWPDAVEGAGYLFSLGTDKGWKSTPVLYWNLLPETDSTTFYALHTPEATPEGNQMPDLLAATATAERYQPVSLSFAHLSARLDVVLKAGNGLTPEEVETATVTLPQALTAYKLKGITPVASTDVRRNITLTGTGSKRRALLLPQIVEAGGRLLVVGISGQEYYVPATAANGVFEAGKTYTLTLTVNRTQVDFSVSISPWTVGGESEGDAGMNID